MASSSKSKTRPTTVSDVPNAITVGDVRRATDEQYEPLTMVLSTGKQISFPHLAVMEVARAEDIAITLQRARTFVALRKWLSKDDLEALRAEKFTLLEMARLARILGAHFSEAFAELGVDLPGMTDDDDLVDVDA